MFSFHTQLFSWNNNSLSSPSTHCFYSYLFWSYYFTSSLYGYSSDRVLPWQPVILLHLLIIFYSLSTKDFCSVCAVFSQLIGFRHLKASTWRPMAPEKEEQSEIITLNQTAVGRGVFQGAGVKVHRFDQARLRAFSSGLRR